MTDRRPLLDLVADWATFLAADGAGDVEPAYERLRAGERTGRPVGDAGLIDRLEATLGRRIHHQKPGPKPGREQTEQPRERARR